MCPDRDESQDWIRLRAPADTVLDPTHKYATRDAP
jgi:hypothetical protein